MARKWSLTVMALLLISAVFLGACGSGSENESQTGSPAGETENGGPENGKQDGSAAQNGNKQITLRFAWWGNAPRHEATLQAVDKYMELNPDVTIEAEYMGFDGYFKKLSTQIAGNSAPDVFQYSYAWHSQIGDFLLDLNTMPSIDTSTISEDTLENFATYKDRLIMMPAGAFAATSVINKDFMQTYGIPVDAEWTWDMVLEEGKKVHAQNPEAYLMTADIDVIEKLIIQAYVGQLSGNNWIEPDYTPGFTEEQLIEAYTYLSDLYDNGVLEPFGDSTAFVGKMEQNPKWIQGEIGMLLDYVQALDKYKQSLDGTEIGVARFPEMENSGQSGNPVIVGTGFSIFANSPHAEEAARFINWMINEPAGAELLGTHRGIPPSEPARKILEESGKLDPDVSKGFELAQERKAVAPSVLSLDAELAQIHKDALQKLIYDKLTPEEAAAEVMTNFTKKLAEMKAE